MTTYTIIPASEKQVNFVRDLIATREVDVELAEEIESLIANEQYDKRVASDHIDDFLKLAKRPKAKSGLQKALAEVPKSKYAIPMTEIEFLSLDDSFSGDIIFLEIREYMGTIYMRQLHGAPGSFNRSKLTNNTVEVFVDILKEDPYKYARIFGQHHACCGSCGADLTDPRSRELQLGPECRKKFGF